MTDVAIALTPLTNAAAGTALAADLRSQLGGARPDAVLVFASSRNDYLALLQALKDGCDPAVMVGCSSAGEFTRAEAGEGLTCAMALRSDSLQFRGVMAGNLGEDHAGAARTLVAGFAGAHDESFRYRTALVLVDALAGHADGLVEELTLLTGGYYQFFGGGAGDDARFQETCVFHGTDARSNAVVALEILSNKPIGIGVRHGWTAASDALRVTEAESMVLATLNAVPAVEVFDEHAAATSQPFDHTEPIPFFLHNILGVQTDQGHRLRVPLGVDQAGGVSCAAEVPPGSIVNIMKTSAQSAADAAAEAVKAALDQLQGHKPKVALFFDCVATRLRLGREFGQELEAMARELDGIPYAGFNTYGQIARADGQFNGFHNCTAVVCVLPE